MANSGDQSASAATEAHFAECFRDYDTIVGPSASRVHHIRYHLDACEQTPDVVHVRKAVRELIEFLHDDLRQSRASRPLSSLTRWYSTTVALRCKAYGRHSRQRSQRAQIL
jgi:hypothetical protein